MQVNKEGDLPLSSSVARCLHLSHQQAWQSHNTQQTDGKPCRPQSFLLPGKLHPTHRQALLKGLGAGHAALLQACALLLCGALEGHTGQLLPEELKPPFSCLARYKVCTQPGAPASVLHTCQLACRAQRVSPLHRVRHQACP